eukprot:SAG31_NODE_40757_length_279_cov_0.688889_1_plen_74_part_01
MAPMANARKDKPARPSGTVTVVRSRHHIWTGFMCVSQFCSMAHQGEPKAFYSDETIKQYNTGSCRSAPARLVEC